MTMRRMYTDNGNRAGFWVQHRSWRNTCGQVQSVAGHQAGKLPDAGPLPDDPDVIIQCFDVRSGRPVQPGPLLQTPHDKHYRLIAEPSWSRHVTEVTVPA
jgi:hypothetical protein